MEKEVAASDSYFIVEEVYRCAIEDENDIPDRNEKSVCTVRRSGSQKIFNIF